MTEIVTACFLKLLTVSLLISYSSGLLVVKTLNVECFGASSYIRNISCKLKPVNRDKSLLYMDADVVNTLNLSIHLQLLKKNDANNFQPFMLNIRASVCDVMDNKISSTYISIIKKILKNTTNVLHPCPYTGHLMASGLYFDTKLFPVNPPLGIYKAVAIFHNGVTGDWVGKIIFQGELREVQHKKTRPVTSS
ncbi:uncharacterized protein LOC115066398 [Bactrocera dorsalis]|uniref:Uncharacterized protein LOC115066398 n=1 Tax=Bactrocera dorsalis TaxID=27457 RepID=A0A8N4QJV8_BACDO|nr:uncharacterized protein LOC115066398 [Bactrocera dorsalis]